MLAARERRKPARLLHGRPVPTDHVREHQVRVEDPGQAHPAAAELLDDHRVGRVVEAEPAVLGGDGGAEEAELLHPLDERVRILVRVLVFARDRDHVALDEAADGVEHLRAQLVAVVHR